MSNHRCNARLIQVDRVGSGRRNPRTRRNRSENTRLSPVELLILIACLVALIAVFATALSDWSSPPVETIPVRVMANQTLWQLATEYPIDGLTTAQTVERIKHLNTLATSNITEGERLLVPASTNAMTAVASRQ